MTMTVTTLFLSLLTTALTMTTGMVTGLAPTGGQSFRSVTRNHGPSARLTAGKASRTAATNSRFLGYGSHALSRGREKKDNGGNTGTAILQMVLDLPSREKTSELFESAVEGEAASPSPPSFFYQDTDIPMQASAEELAALYLLDTTEGGLTPKEAMQDTPPPLKAANNIIFTDKSNPLPLSPSKSMSVVDTEEKDEDEEKDSLSLAPGVAKIAKFAIPAIGVYMCGPLLSLIDTAAVGLLAGTNHQAALSPAVAVTDYASLLLGFLYTATTNLVAASSIRGSSGANAEDQSSKQQLTPEETLVSALQLSLMVGAGLGLVIFTLSKAMVKGLIGNDAIDPAVLLPAVQYVKIRALGAPAAAVLGSAQAACLGLKDIKSPLLVLLSAAVINLVGDFVFVGSGHPLFHGAAGAAWATVFSQYAAVVFFLHWLKTKSGAEGVVARLGRFVTSRIGRKGDSEKLNAISPRKRIVSPVKARISRIAMVPKAMHAMSTSVVTAVNRVIPRRSAKVSKAKSPSSEFSTRGYLAQQNFRKRDILAPPKSDTVSKFIPYVVPVTTTNVGRVSLFLTMAHVVSSCMGTVGMAAQQIILAMFEALCPIADSLSLTAQSFIPAIFESATNTKSGEDDRSVAEMRKATKQFLQAGGLFGGAIVTVVACIPWLSRFFTTDPLVAAQVSAIAPFLAGVFALHGVIMAAEGVLLGRKDLNFLGGTYGIYFALVPAMMLRLKRFANMSAAGLRLQSVWKIFLAYQVSRTVLWIGRALWLTRRIPRQSEASQAQALSGSPLEAVEYVHLESVLEGVPSASKPIVDNEDEACALYGEAHFLLTPDDDALLFGADGEGVQE